MATARTIALSQILLSVLFLAAYFCVLLVFLLGWVRTPADWKDALIALLGVITGSVLNIVSFWFSRGREKDKDAGA